MAEARTRAWRQERLAASRLYLCTDSRRGRGDLEDFLRAALRGGVDIVQLREKGLEAQEELQLLEIFIGIAGEFGALVSANDRADLAALSPVDVLHLGQDDLTPAQARVLVGPELLLGRSSHDAAQGGAEAADPEVDYYCVGPVWATPTKPGRPAAGFDALTAAAGRDPGKPWFGIGGIESVDRLDRVTAAGATRIVVVRAITLADDPEAAARALRERLPA